MRTVLGFVSIIAALLVVTLPTDAQEVRVGNRTYPGVVPGTSNNPGHLLGSAGSNPVIVTWPGFVSNGSGGTRFFLQVTTQVQTETRSEPGRVVVLLRGARIPDRQTARPLDTRFFDTPVTRARLERRGRDAAFVLDVRAGVMPQVTTSPGENGYTFVYVDFPAGHYLPADMEPPPPVPTPQSSNPAPMPSPERQRAMEREAPPPMEN